MLDQKCRKAFETRDLLTMRVFLEKLIIDGNHDDVDTYKKSPLMYACNFGDFELVKTLLDAGVDVNKLSIDGDSAIMYAIRNNSKVNGAKIVELLLRYGADIDSDINKKNEYPLLIAAKLDNVLCFKLLLPYSLWCCNHIDKYGYSAVSYAHQNSCKRELDKFSFRVKVKKSIQNLGTLFLRLITSPFILISNISVYILIKLGILEQQPINTVKNSNVISGSTVRFSDEAPQQYDAQFEAFAHNIKNHIECTLKKSEAVTSHLKDNLNESEAIVFQLKRMPKESELFATQLKNATTQYEIAKNIYIANSIILEVILEYKKRFDSYNFFDNSRCYIKTNFFETSRKYIISLMPLLGQLETAFNSVEFSQTKNINSKEKPIALQFSRASKSKNNTNDLYSLSEKLNRLSLKKIQLTHLA